MLWIALIIAGAFGGFSGGLLGIGGGTILVPALVAVYTQMGAAPGSSAKVAIATSLATIIFLSASAVVAHRRKKSLSLREAAWLSGAGALGAWLGSDIAIGLDGETLLKVFGLFEIVVGLRMYLTAGSTPNASKMEANPADQTKRLALTGGLSGIIASLFGVGGGVIAVPLQVFAGIPIHRAIGNSSAMIVVNAFAGTVRYLLAPQTHLGVGEILVGQVDLIGVAGMGISAMLFAQLGAKAAHALDPTPLKRAFGVFLVILGAVFALDLL